MSAAWFASLEPLHRTRGRVRLRYRCRSGTTLDALRITRGVEAVAGVRRVQVNTAARSMAVEYETGETDPDRLAQAILALKPPPVRTAQRQCLMAMAAPTSDQHLLSSSSSPGSIPLLQRSTRLRVGQRFRL